LDLKGFRDRTVELELNEAGYFTVIALLQGELVSANEVEKAKPVIHKKIEKKVINGDYDFDTMMKQEMPLEKKGNLNYVSWAYAWGELKRLYPTANYVVYENENKMPYFWDGSGAFVKVGVIVSGIEHISYLPVLDFKNKPIKADEVNTFEINKSIQRALVKAIAMHGLGLYVYRGEDTIED
jgi:hypothetical protein